MVDRVVVVLESVEMPVYINVAGWLEDQCGGGEAVHLHTYSSGHRHSGGGMEVVRLMMVMDSRWC